MGEPKRAREEGNLVYSGEEKPFLEFMNMNHLCAVQLIPQSVYLVSQQRVLSTGQAKGN